MAVFPDVLPSVGNDLIIGTGLVDYLTGFYGNDTIRGGAGNDIIVEAIFTWPNSGLTLADGFQVRGGLTYDFGRGNDSIDGGAGQDLLTYDDRRVGIVVDLALGRVTTGTEVDRFIGIEAVELGNGADLVYANKAGFVVDLSAGNDRVIGMAGQSLYIGGDGNDTLDLSGFRTPVKVFLDTFTVQVGVNTAQVQEFETVLGSLTAANTMRGNERNNTLIGGAGNDFLDGRFNSDRLEGGAGNDSLYGGFGNDTLIGGLGNDLMSGADDHDVIYGLEGNDTLLGGAGLDSLTGGAGDDYLDLGVVGIVQSAVGEVAYGGDGNDRLNATGAQYASLYGGAGNDVIFVSGRAFGESGDDSFFGNTAIEVYGGSGFDTYFVSGGRTFILDPGLHEMERIVFTGVEDHAIVFNLSRLTQTLSAGADRVFISAISNDNVIYSGEGADIFTVNGQRNQIDTGGGNDRVDAASRSTMELDTGDGNDFVTSAANDSIIQTGNGADTVDLFGSSGTFVDLGAGDDTVLCHRPNSEIELGAGDDEIVFVSSFFQSVLLSTGSGADILTFNNAYNIGQLTVTAFDVGSDRIHILGIDQMSDWTSVSQSVGAVVLNLHDPSRAGLTIRLEGLQVSDLTDAIFSV